MSTEKCRHAASSASDALIALADEIARMPGPDRFDPKGVEQSLRRLADVLRDCHGIRAQPIDEETKKDWQINISGALGRIEF